MTSPENPPPATGDANDKTVELINSLKPECEAEYFNSFDSKKDLKKFCANHTNFLPLICEIGDERLAVTYGGGILTRLLSTSDFFEGRQAFINQQAGKKSLFAGKTSIEIAISRNWQQMTKILLESSADVTFTKTSKNSPLEEIYSKFHTVMIDQLDQNIKLMKDDFDDSNELLWKVKYRYRPIVGAPSELDTKRYLPTDLLVKILRLKAWKRNEVLTHPLTRLFLHEESSKIKWTIWLSIGFHVFWYLYSALVLTSLTIGSEGKDVSDRFNNETGNYSTSGLVTITRTLTSETYLKCVFYAAYSIVFLGVFVKESFELYLAPDKIYYWTQHENLGQWLLFITVISLGVLRPIQACGYLLDWNCSLKSVCVAGILNSGLLVQGQLTKTKLGGMFNIMLRTALIRFGKFTLAYSPLLISFSCVFNLLLHQVRNEFADNYGVFKVATVFAGELDFKDTFYGEGAYTSCNLPGLIVFTIFVIVVTIILHNILVALTVDDIKELAIQSLVRQMAAELELIHILKAFKDRRQLIRGWIEDKKSGGKNSSHQLNGSGPQNGGKEENGQELKDLEANGTKSQAPISSTSNPWMEMSYQELPYKLKICIKNHFQDESK